MRRATTVIDSSRTDNGAVNCSDIPPPDAMDNAVLGAVRDALLRFPEGSATLRQRWQDRGGWTVEVQPRAVTAAAFSVTLTDGDILSVAVGRLSFEIFPVKSLDDLDYLRDIAAAVFAGRVEESRYRNRAWGRIYLDEGPVNVGSVHTPWARPKRHIYDAYR